MRLLAVLLVAALLSGCAGPPVAAPPVPGQFTMQLLGASPSPTTMRWNIALGNGQATAITGIKLSISVKFYNQRDAGHDEQTFDVPANNTTVVLLRTPYMGFGDYDYVLQARAADGTILDTQQDLYELCLC